MTWSDTASKYHDDLAKAMRPYRNKDLTTKSIRNIVVGIPELKDHVAFIQPPDHCVNHTNDGPCSCSQTDRAIFLKLKRGLYRVL